MTMGVGVEALGRYELALVLSYLNECEGVSLMITKKRYGTVLRLFRLPERGIRVVGDKHRHKFIEYPAQDPEVLLQRLNTRRLRKRINRRIPGEKCYEFNKTTRELALTEQQQHATNNLPAHEELLRFLAPKDTTNGKTLLVSYPRSGNTLLRNLLERLSGIVTGSDNRPDRKLSRDLAVKHNLIGEGVTNTRIQVLKTHYPERPGFRAKGKRAILLVRNPYDAIDSYWNLNLTNTHTETVVDDVYEKYNDTFEDLAKNEMEVWIMFHRYWLEASIPVLLLRFEDLISNMEHELTRVADFLQLDHARVRHACGCGDNTQLGSYRPRSTGRKPFGKSLEKGRYSEEMMQEFESIAKKCPGWDDKTMLEFFGYDTPAFPDNFMAGNAKCIPDAPLGGASEAMVINTGYRLRPPTDKYGRSMKEWRQERTNFDHNPFPTVQR